MRSMEAPHRSESAPPGRRQCGGITVLHLDLRQGRAHRHRVGRVTCRQEGPRGQWSGEFQRGSPWRLAKDAAARNTERDVVMGRGDFIRGGRGREGRVGVTWWKSARAAAARGAWARGGGRTARVAAARSAESEVVEGRAGLGRTERVRARWWEERAGCGRTERGERGGGRTRGTRPRERMRR